MANGKMKNSITYLGKGIIKVCTKFYSNLSDGAD